MWVNIGIQYAFSVISLIAAVYALRRWSGSTVALPASTSFFNSGSRV